MTLLLVSDTHGRTAALEKILATYAADCQFVCHMGNHPSDLFRFGAGGQPQFVAVLGNDDYGSNAPREIVLPVSTPAGERRIFIAHGHGLDVHSGHDRLVYRAKERDCHAAFYGHTHIPVVENTGGIFVANPGSPVAPRGGSTASFAVVEISESGDFTGEVISVASL